MKYSAWTWAALAALNLQACTSNDAPNTASMTEAMNGYLAARGDLCIAKSNWPIDVRAASVGANGAGRDALQMPVLEKLGLVASTEAMTTLTQEDRPPEQVAVRRYALTAEGRKYWHDATSRAGAKPDVCVAHLTLAKVVGWDRPVSHDGHLETVVTYTYRIDAAPWMQTPDAQRVFPMVARVLAGAETLELKQAFAKTDSGWRAVDLAG